jgi:CDP-diacylglycerol--glycerol-3-phosphate 3-phosphatidyltransferase
MNGTTNFGKIFDPAADKILVFPVLVCFLKLNLIEASPLILLLIREFLMSAVRLELSKVNSAIEADVFGKIKTILQMTSICIIMFCRIHFVSFYLSVSHILLWTSAVFSWVSFILILNRNGRIFKNK